MSDDGTSTRLYAIYLCDLCVQGKGGECHSPGCALWINRAPDLALTTPLLPPMEEYLAERAAQRSGGEGRRAAVPQPAPTGEGTPVLPAVLAHPLVTPRMRADLQARAIDGAEKYGTVLRSAAAGAGRRSGAPARHSPRRRGGRPGSRSRPRSARSSTTIAARRAPGPRSRLGSGRARCPAW